MESYYDTRYASPHLHADLERGQYCGHFGGSYSVYHALCELKFKQDLTSFRTRRSADERIDPALMRLLSNSVVSRHWERIVTIDPWGLVAKRPTISSTTALLHIPEFELAPFIVEKDGNVVLQDGSVKTTKIAIDYVWNLPGISRRLGVEEKKLREALYKYTGDETLKKEELRAYLPPTEGVTVYLFGDIERLGNARTEVALRVHDECNSSDTFGSDMCTCRPYLIYAMQGAIECAQRGGIGVIIYFRKEGRSLGEVIKYRVYNARQNQEGGDRPEMYFKQTESIAGIQDARMQELMPDVILWLGISRIDKLLSMSSDKFEAIIGAGIEVMERVSLPEDYVPSGAMTEITAKIASGYASNSKLTEQVYEQIMDLNNVRAASKKVYELAKQNKTKYFSLHLEKLEWTIDFVTEVIRTNYPSGNIPHHSRWRHFEQVTSIEDLKKNWKCSDKEKVRRLVDLAVISVLLDAGTGTKWKYLDKDNRTLTRSEGLAKATLDMFEAGMFSSDPASPHRVNTLGILKLTFSDFKHALQHSITNPLASIDARYKVLQKFAESLALNPHVFGYEVIRPGNLVDWALRETRHDHSSQPLSMYTLFGTLVRTFSSVWPTNTPKIKQGDVWQYQLLKVPGVPGSDLVPFHKITQWVCYSLYEPLTSLGISISDLDALTALAEYRNGGLFFDSGVLSLKNPSDSDYEYDVGAELVIEWRSLTIALVDLIAPHIRKNLNMSESELPMSKILQGGTWDAGRKLAQRIRPDGSPPISIRLNGITF
ncbi:uncharacterized protein LOC126313327 [Schistocerca gregaria]|uniref:uncharacterized protein LOC126313327 n=1 Tax=Schistocerca gregaria TaxID=7010 RepID=UPI00211E8FE5|nr:uncharacterized protein LOC126313327 [Schistocerca gregaria]